MQRNGRCRWLAEVSMRQQRCGASAGCTAPTHAEDLCRAAHAPRRGTDLPAHRTLEQQHPGPLHGSRACTQFRQRACELYTVGAPQWMCSALSALTYACADTGCCFPWFSVRMFGPAASRIGDRIDDARLRGAARHAAAHDAQSKHDFNHSRTKQRQRRGCATAALLCVTRARRAALQDTRKLN